MFTFSIDIENQDWICEGEIDSHDTVNILIYYITSPKVTSIKNFKFEYPLVSDFVTTEEVVATERQRGIDIFMEPIGPGPYYKYLVGDIEFTNLKPETTYYFDLKASNRRQPWSRKFEFTTLRSPAPYPSWMWNPELKEWEPPLEKPDPVWDEESGGWVIP